MSDKPGASAAPRVLHLHSTFAAGGKELRSVQLINAFGSKLAHAIVSADPNNYGAAAHIAKGRDVRYPRDFPSLKGKPWPGRLHALARAMKPYDLVLTYNWGAMDAVMAHTLFKDALQLPPLIHHEDGFNEDEQNRLKTSRNWYRRIALGKANGLVVPSEVLEGIALETWQQPIGRVKHIPNGIDTKAFTANPKPDALRGVIKHEGERWVGTLAGLRPVKNLSALIRAVATLPEEWQLVIVGEGPEGERLRDAAEAAEISHRVHMPGFVANPQRYIGLFDIFALSSLSEQFPLSVVEAMAAGLPVAAPAVGDIAAMVSEENARFIVPPGSEAALAEALDVLAQDADARGAVGEANRVKARASFDEAKMIATYRRLYDSALGGGVLGSGTPR
ncbi:glycosyltransferase family 4 protein [Alteriqipengyuania lutimaris]|uniref:Glycosyltransferase family 1 protein n=1 Tax=Alteriqipengyuania lutimaris TaxID=1538146 RepID=A0A395LL63_9SPHN|nr:glycosyltransferase family 4 protein [Alteriqipengyuania lutimaris]MBB3033172.1 glycosyltransferase involved in cell wall biosynthesis [Alteriqipengyuania lutimaris]RDS77776.1 glycosyltransferase family 1 protein [Alteriqipengyuania lutimaris]